MWAGPRVWSGPRVKPHLNIFGDFLLHESWKHLICNPISAPSCNFLLWGIVLQFLLRSNHKEQLQMVVASEVQARTQNGFSSVPGERALSSPLNSFLREQGGLQPELAVLCLAVSPVPPPLLTVLGLASCIASTAVCMPCASCFLSTTQGQGRSANCLRKEDLGWEEVLLTKGKPGRYQNVPGFFFLLGCFFSMVPSQEKVNCLCSFNMINNRHF